MRLTLRKNVGSNMCLQPENGSTDLFAAIVQKPCDGGIAQGWEYQRVATNPHRSHTALGGQPPITRVNNPAGQYT
ncbi:hypothetical protein [Streptomyces sp. NPDC002588]|uniref:RICIN domain-containing protein n=1 Tax=Streptomyces sp. NPDC002588 TaxID=3154419 RepID=UPI0033276F6A